MDDVAADVDGQIATNGAGLSLEGLGGTDQLAGTGDHTIAFPDHGHHRAGGDEIDQTSKEGTLLVDAVVLFGQGAAGSDLLQAHQLEPLALKAAEDFAHQPTLDAVGLDGDERAFGHGMV